MNKGIYFGIIFILFFESIQSSTLEFEHKYITLSNGLTIHYVEKGEQNSIAVVLLHGFPELWYSWKHQINGLSGQYRVIAPDMRGYGDSDKPSFPLAYDIHNLTNDVVLILDALGIDKVHLVGHDWGAVVAWSTAFLNPDRLYSVTGLSVPSHFQFATVESMVEKFGEDFYINRFQEYGIAEEVFDLGNIEVLFKLVFWTPRQVKQDHPTLSGWATGVKFIKLQPKLLPPVSWFSAEDLEIYTKAFKKNGFTAPLSYYRNWNRNIEILNERAKQTGGYAINIPSYFIGANHDLNFLKDAEKDHAQFLTNYHGTAWVDSGHFISIEKPDEVNDLLLKFFQSIVEQKQEL